MTQYIMTIPRVEVFVSHYIIKVCTTVDNLYQAYKTTDTEGDTVCNCCRMSRACFVQKCHFVTGVVFYHAEMPLCYRSDGGLL